MEHVELHFPAWGAALIRVVNDPRVSNWVIKQLDWPGIKLPTDFGPHVSFGVMEEGRALAGIVFNRFRKMPYGNDISVTVAAASPRWAQRAVLQHLIDYAFLTSGCVRLSATTREGNERVARFLRGIGFRKEGVARRAFGGKSNAILWSLLPHEFILGAH